MRSRLIFEDLNDGVFTRLQLKVTPNINLEQIQLFIIHNPAFIIPVNIFFVSDLQAHDTRSFDAEIYLSEADAIEIFSTTITIMVSFINKQSIARVLKHAIDIPLNYVVRAAQPQKDGIFKVTLNSVAIVELNEVFKGKFAHFFEPFFINLKKSDLTPSESTQATAIRTLNSENPVTIVAAKSSNRYRSVHQMSINYDPISLIFNASNIFDFLPFNQITIEWPCFARFHARHHYRAAVQRDNNIERFGEEEWCVGKIDSIVNDRILVIMH